MFISLLNLPLSKQDSCELSGMSMCLCWPKILQKQFKIKLTRIRTCTVKDNFFEFNTLLYHGLSIFQLNEKPFCHTFSLVTWLYTHCSATNMTFTVIITGQLNAVFLSETFAKMKPVVLNLRMIFECFLTRLLRRGKQRRQSGKDSSASRDLFETLTLALEHCAGTVYSNTLQLHFIVTGYSYTLQ